MEFEHNNEVTEKIDKTDAENIVDMAPDSILGEGEEEEPDIVTAWVKVYGPVYEKDAKFWKFEYNGHHENMDISETDIAEKALRRGGALANDTYRVKLQITQTTTESGQIKAHYKILKVIKFNPATLSQQNDMFRKDNEP